MTVASADLHTAVITLWNSSGLNDIFKAFWAAADEDDYSVLHDEEAAPGQPFPYCVFKQDEGSTTSRMTSATSTGRMEIRDVPWEFRIYTRSFFGNPKSAKQIAAELMDEVMKVFGGHPTESAQDLTLENGSVLQSTYLTDIPIRKGDYEWEWLLRYKLLLDVPVRT